MSRTSILLIALLLAQLVGCAATAHEDEPPGMIGPNDHPRLFFTRNQQRALRGARTHGERARIWENMRVSAEWCLKEPLRKEWIAPVTPDPIHENLYDRFYAMMHDMAVSEYLAFAYAYSGDDRYGDAAHDWLMSLCRVWSREADGEPDGGKAYAVSRLLKGLGVGYDLLYDRLSDAERAEVRRTILIVGRKYYDFFRSPEGHFGPGFETHHGSVDAASFGIAALAIRGEEPEADKWVELAVQKHLDWLFPMALTPSGTHQQNPGFWGSIMQYRIAFMDALRRNTGRDLFTEQRERMPWRVALATIVARGPDASRFDASGESSLFGFSVANLSPVLLFLAREYRVPVLQRMAMWDEAIGSITRSQFTTPHGERWITNWGAYAYAWYDRTVPDDAPADLPRSFLFSDPDPNPILHVNEAFVRASYDPGDLAAGQRRSLVILHAGGRAVFMDFAPPYPPPTPVADLALMDDGTKATITSKGVVDSGFAEQSITLERPNRLVLRRVTKANVRWWCLGKPTRDGNTLRWPDGTTLRVITGGVVKFDAEGYTPENIVGLGVLKLKDEAPRKYAVIEAEPADGVLEIEVTKRAAK